MSKQRQASKLEQVMAIADIIPLITVVIMEWAAILLAVAFLVAAATTLQDPALQSTGMYIICAGGSVGVAMLGDLYSSRQSEDDQTGGG